MANDMYQIKDKRVLMIDNSNCFHIAIKGSTFVGMKLKSWAYSPFIEEMNRMGERSIPFVFIVDYEKSEGFIQPIAGLDSSSDLQLSIKGRYESTYSLVTDTERDDNITFSSQVESLESYAQRFEIIQNGLQNGDSFLANLTLRTPISTQLSLLDIFQRTQATYKVYLKDRFVCFSPECFFTIDSTGKIATFPMKGTIDATIPNAEEKIINDPKELAEHATIVDLMRNDLSQIADNVRVEKFRYIDHIITNKGELLQVSSAICGNLEKGWTSRIGTILDTMLPAGSICGAPKKATVELIQRAEGCLPRKFYTGVCGHFDGKTLNTGVMIRFVEQSENGQLYYRSGGGITINSQKEKEYKEVVEKIYLPL